MSMRLAMSATFRASRSSLAISSVALAFPAAQRASCPSATQVISLVPRRRAASTAIGWELAERVGSTKSHEAIDTTLLGNRQIEDAVVGGHLVGRADQRALGARAVVAADIDDRAARSANLPVVRTGRRTAFQASRLRARRLIRDSARASAMVHSSPQSDLRHATASGQRQNCREGTERRRHESHHRSPPEECARIDNFSQSKRCPSDRQDPTHVSSISTFQSLCDLLVTVPLLSLSPDSFFALAAPDAHAARRIGTPRWPLSRLGGKPSLASVSSGLWYCVPSW